MNKLAFPLSIGALAVLGACTTYEPASPAPVVITQPPVVTAPAGTVLVPPVAQTPVVVPQTAALRPGHGRIEAVSIIPSAGSASTGASAPSGHRLAVKMDDGTLQYVDTSAINLAVGDRIELTRDGYIRRP